MIEAIACGFLWDVGPPEGQPKPPAVPPRAARG